MPRHSQHLLHLAQALEDDGVEDVQRTHGELGLGSDEAEKTQQAKFKHLPPRHRYEVLGEVKLYQAQLYQIQAKHA